MTASRTADRTTRRVARRMAYLVAVAAALPLAACSWDCGTVRRTVATGTLRDAAGVTLATVQVDLVERVGPSALELSAGVLGPAGSAGAPLRGRVTRARLVTDGGEVLAEIPTDTAALYPDAAVALRVARLSGAEYARVRTALLGARARVVLDTDLPGRARVEAALPDVREDPGEIHRCSPA